MDTRHRDIVGYEPSHDIRKGKPGLDNEDLTLQDSLLTMVLTFHFFLRTGEMAMAHCIKLLL